MKFIKEKQFSDLQEISIEGCEEIGRGAYGTVYKTAPDMIVKVYHDGVSMDAVRKEQALARWAFVKGIPTAIPFTIVRVGERLGTEFELLDAVSASEYIRNSQEHLERFIDQSVKLMKLIHGIEVDRGELPDMKQQTLNWVENIKARFSQVHNEMILNMINRIPDRSTLLHADYHLKNIMISNDELMLIDMDTLCTGDPIFELATVYNSYREFPSINPEAAHFIGIDVDTAAFICDKTFEKYLESSDPGLIQETVRTARLIGCIRIIDFSERHQEHPASQQCIECSLRDIKMILDSLIEKNPASA